MEERVTKSRTNCSVVGCNNTYRNCTPGTRFFVFPNNKEHIIRRKAWIAALKRDTTDGKPWNPTSNSRVCSRHFVDGTPTRDPDSPGYIPRLYMKPNLCDQHQQREERRVTTRYKRRKQREETAMVDNMDIVKEEIISEEEYVPMTSVLEDNVMEMKEDDQSESVISTSIETGIKLSLGKVKVEPDLDEDRETLSPKLDFCNVKVEEEPESFTFIALEESGSPPIVKDEFKCEVTSEEDDVESHMVPSSTFPESGTNTSKQQNYAEELCDPDLSETQGKHTAGKAFECNICHLQFASMSSLKLHTDCQPHASEEYETSKRSLTVHYMSHTDEVLHNCSICNKKFASMTDLVSHLIIHTGKKHYTCKDCGKVFKRSSGLHDHKRTHTGERPFQCDLCTMAFTCNKTLYRHKLKHTGCKPHKCGVCGKMFALNFRLTEHMRTHTGERPYMCNVCETRFRQRSTLVRHMETHSLGTEYMCPDCGKSFSKKRLLVQHKNTHKGYTPFKCDLCPKIFSYRVSLARHRLSHTGEKPYVCTICNNRFRQTSILTRHMQTHSLSATTYSCPECDKSFSSKRYLQQHKKKHMGITPFKCDLCPKSFSYKTSLVKHLLKHTGDKV